MQRFWGAITEERPFLKRNELAVLDWRLNPADRRTGKQVARDLGVTPGAVSKIGARVEERVQRQLRK